MSPTTYGWLVLAFPLLGTLVSPSASAGCPGRSRRLARHRRDLPVVPGGARRADRAAGSPAGHRQLVSSLWNYASTVGIDAQLSILVDPLSVFMILVVTGVSTLIHLYSISYMDGDRGFARFFAYLNFFVFSMLLLVLAGNFLLLIVGWAFVGAASYLLISFWYRRTTATRAGIKAFVINVVGDVGLVLGTYFIFKHTGTLDLLRRPSRPPTRRVRHATNDGDLVAGCVLLLVGAFAKSAQIPLHTWLPGRDGGTDAGQRADPRGDDGHRRRLPDRPHAPAVRTGAGGAGRRRDRRRARRCSSPARSAWRRRTSSA